MWCKSLVWWCKISTFAPHLKHALIIELGMKGLTIVKRTNKTEGTIRLRFRLRDGRGVDLYHKSEIDADLKDLDKFADTGELKSRVSVYNKKLKLDIDTEIDAMETAYKQLCAQKDKTRITTDEFEKAIAHSTRPTPHFSVFHDVEEVKAAIAKQQPQHRYILIKGSNSVKLYQLPELL